jgi:hypothetical protein
LVARIFGATFLFAGIGSLSLTAPIPPLASPGRKKWIAGLGYSGGKDVLAAYIDLLASSSAKFLIKLCGILAGKLLHAADAKKLKTAEHGWSYRDQIL